MLQAIRDWTTGWLATAIVALLIIPFAFWGIDSYFGGTEPVVARINGEKIRLTQFQRAFNSYRQQLQALLDRNIDIEDEIIKQQALDRLIESRLLAQVSHSAGLRVSDEQVLDVIKGIEAFRTEDGTFNRAFYEQAVLRQGLQPADFENQMRQDMTGEQLRSAVVESVFVSDKEARIAARLQNQTRDFTHTIISASKLRADLNISDEEIQDYFESSKSRYAIPEQVQINYIELSMDKLAADVAVDEQSLRDYYALNKSDFDKKEQRKIDQLLIKVNENDTEGEVEMARTKAEDIRQSIAAGKSFEDITETYDDDPDFSFTEYGFTQRGVMPDAVEEAVFALEPGGVTEVVKSEQGFHIIKLVDMKGGVMNTFEKNRKAVEAAYRRSIAEDQFFDLADRLAVAAFEHPDTLEIAAEETGLSVETSHFFSREGTNEGLTSEDKIITASFAEETLENGLNSEMLELTDTHLVVLRVRERKPESVPSLETVREEVVSDIRSNRARELARERGESILASLREGTGYAAIAEKTGVEWQESTNTRRNAVTVNRAVLRKAFSLGGSGSELPIYGGLSLGSGDYAVVGVQKIMVPDADSLETATIEEVKAELQQARSASAWINLIQEMREEADIEIYENRI